MALKPIRRSLKPRDQLRKLVRLEVVHASQSPCTTGIPLLNFKPRAGGDQQRRHPMTMRQVCLVALATTTVLLVTACGSNVKGAVADSVRAQYPEAKVLGCEKTGQVYQGETVWNCGIRRSEGSGTFAKEVNAIEDARRPPLSLCFIVRSGEATGVGC